MIGAILWSQVFAWEGFTGPAGQQPPQESREAQCTISVNVDEVRLPITVLDEKGRFVTGLEEKNFRIYEDGVLQRIQSFEHQDIPVTVGLVIDSSGSMGPKLPEVKAAALAFASSSNPKTKCSASHSMKRFHPVFPMTCRLSTMRISSRRFFPTSDAIGKTALYDAIAVAMDHLKKGHWEKKVLIHDEIELTTLDGVYRYRITKLKIAQPDNIEVLEPTGAETLTLVTCYPFYFIGSAPQRFIVQAERSQS